MLVLRGTRVDRSPVHQAHEAEVAQELAFQRAEAARAEQEKAREVLAAVEVFSQTVA